MFRLIRTIILVAVAFVSGVLYERFNVSLNCDNIDGDMRQGLCVGASQ